ncbi:hypothetical protein CPI84_10450 [Erwinia pyrifoliae]|nr:hypothetical protein CPI84_10450 [Erwinia pyrifoliae]
MTSEFTNAPERWHDAMGALQAEDAYRAAPFSLMDQAGMDPSSISDARRPRADTVAAAGQRGLHLILQKLRAVTSATPARPLALAEPLSGRLCQLTGYPAPGWVNNAPVAKERGLISYEFFEHRLRRRPDGARFA